MSSRHSGGDEGTNGYGALIDTKFNQILVEHILSYGILDNDIHKLDFTGVHALMNKISPITSYRKQILLTTDFNIMALRQNY